MRVGKRAFDLTLASIALAVLAPVMLLVAIAIRSESQGPIIFRQQRLGMDERPFELWKFRSMRAEHCDPTARQVVVRRDPRVTRVGRFLRRSSLDELPQLFNVLRGEMSLVGPRPHVVDAVSSGRQLFTDLVENYRARQRVAPGITGLAQVSGWRGEIDDPAKLRARVACDLLYIENWSPWLDLRILLRTPFALLRGQGAY